MILGIYSLSLRKEKPCLSLMSCSPPVFAPVERITKKALGPPKVCLAAAAVVKHALVDFDL